jgi:hypothetical protein
MSNHHTPPHFPIAILVHNGQLILAAAGDHPEVAARLPDGYIPGANALLTKVTADVSGQKAKKGDLGTLTKAQRAALNVLQRWMNKARKTARLAFPGQTVKLHQGFQVGVNGPHDLGSFLGRADIILASVQNEDNLPALQLKGWTDAETQAFVAARKSFGAGDETKEKAKGGGKESTTLKNTDAADLYDALLTVQNAADLQFPEDVPANTGVRDEFQLNTFPPAGGSSSDTPPTPPAPTTPA